MGDAWSVAEKIFLFIGVPSLLLLAYSVPSDIKDAYFILHKDDVSITSMFLSNYTHSDFGHLAGNLLGYLIATYLIVKFEKSRANFYRTAWFLFFFLILPFVVSAVTVAAIPFQNSQGFSGIVAGLSGYFLYVAYRHVKDSWKLNADINFILLLLFINILIGVILAFDYWLAKCLLLIAVLFAITIYFFYANRRLLSSIISVLTNKRQRFFSEVLTFILALLILFSLPFLIQFKVQNGNAANAIAHYAGYIAGVGFPLIFEGIEGLKRRFKLL